MRENSTEFESVLSDKLLDGPDLEWEAAEPEYRGIVLAEAIDSISEEGEVLMVFDSKGNETEVSGEIDANEASSTRVIRTQARKRKTDWTRERI